MRFRYSPRVTIICLLLIAGMLRLSYWQWQRHQWKLGLIKDLQSRLEIPIAELYSLAQTPNVDWGALVFRRVKLSGTFDFEHEMLLRNRRFEKVMGVHAVTPLRLDGSNLAVLVDRGFIPQTKSEREIRKAYQKPARLEFVGLIKESVPRKFFAPSDPPAGLHLPWVDRWLRIDVESMRQQLPYPVLPIFLETMETQDAKAVEQKIVDASASGRDEMFFLNGAQELGTLAKEDVGNGVYPIPVFDTVIPPGRHLGYVFEWAAMAVMTALICLVLQLRRPKALEPQAAN
jgi:surfeit locus 1 family protein